MLIGSLFCLCLLKTFLRAEMFRNIILFFKIASRALVENIVNMSYMSQFTLQKVCSENENIVKGDIENE